MSDGNTLVVDVVASGDGYTLSEPAVNLEIAYEVVRRHKTEAGVSFSQMVQMTKSSEGYTFKFDTGDVFTAPSADAYPNASSVSDETGGSGGGGFLATIIFADDTFSCDKTYAECVAAYEAKTLNAVYFDETAGLHMLAFALNKPERYLELNFGSGADLQYYPDGTIG